MKTRHPEAKLVICGRDKRMKKKLEELAKRLGIEEDVLFVGEVKRSDISYYFAACDVFVIPSLSEGMPNAALEAMACAKPIVATNVGGLPEIVIDGVNGFLVKPKDPEALAEKICILLDNEEMRLKMGKSH